MFDFTNSLSEIIRDFDDLERVDTIDLRPINQGVATDGALLLESGDKILLEDGTSVLLLE